MLESISIKNIALIESADIEFDNSLNVLTGETGAGKSILLDSIGLLLGDRIDKTLLRKGAEDCKVTGRFSLNEFSKTYFKTFCEKYDLEFDEEVIITRTYNLEGKSSIKINGQPITLAMLKELCSNLVNTYGQNENQIIFDVQNHLKILDAFANTTNTLEYSEYSTLYAKLKEIESRLKEFGGSDEDRLRQIDLLNYDINEIESAQISIEDYEDLQNKRRLLLNIGKIISNTALAQNSLSGDVLSSINKAENAINQASNYDDKLQDIANRINVARLELEDIFDTIKSYNQNCDFDENEQQKIEERYSLYNKLMRKYGNSVENVIAKLNNMKSELNNLINADKLILELSTLKNRTEKQLKEVGLKLTEYRKHSAEELSGLILNNLKNLNMKNSKLEFEFMPTDKFYSNGLDRVELLFSANLGEDVKPLNKIASGGEISRFMLALKSVIAKQDNMPTMIFDEIDTGISGATSEAVAKQMAIIGKHHQVIVVTHSHQIASMADTNFLIEKIERENKTITMVKKLNTEEKIREIARFMSGDSMNSVAVDNARLLIKEQDDYKKSLENIDK